MANGYLHSAFESIAGNEVNTPTLSSKVIYTPLNTAQPQLNPSHLERDDELRGIDEPISILAESYDPSWSLATRLYPDLAGFELKAMLGAPVIGVGNGVITDPDGATIPTGVTRHVFTAPYAPTGGNPQTTQRQFSYFDETFFLKAKGCATDTLSISSPATGGVQLAASGPALYLVRQADPSLTPSYETLTIAPFERSHLTIQTFLSGTGETADFTVNVANPAQTVRTLGVASKFPDVMEKGDAPIVVSGSIPKRHLDADDWDALLAATGFTVKARWQSTISIGATSYKYTLWLECNNAQYTGGDPDPLANTRVTGASYNWKATYAGTPGSSKFTLCCATTSYA